MINNNQIAYISRTSLPSNSANTVHLMKICEEFHKIFGEGFVALVSSKNDSTDNICNKYGTEKFNIEEIRINKGKLYSYRFALSAIRYIRRHKIKKVITRDPLTALYAALMGIGVVLDLHGDLRHLCGRAYHIFKIKSIVRRKNFQFSTVTHSIKKHYVLNYNYLYEKMVVIPNGVTLDNYKILSSDMVLKNDIPRIGYIGKFTIGKGIDTIIKIARALPQYRFYMYGGTKDDAENETGLAVSDNVIIGGYVDNNKVPELIKEMDIVLLPNKEKQICNGELMGDFTSPIKMFEYMASGRPIIASDIHVLREVLDEENCFFSREDDISSWIGCIEYINNNRDKALSKSIQARKDVEQYTWEKRAEKLVELIG